MNTQKGDDADETTGNGCDAADAVWRGVCVHSAGEYVDKEGGYADGEIDNRGKRF